MAVPKPAAKANNNPPRTNSPSSICPPITDIARKLNGFGTRAIPVQNSTREQDIATAKPVDLTTLNNCPSLPAVTDMVQ